MLLLNKGTLKIYIIIKSNRYWLIIFTKPQQPCHRFWHKTFPRYFYNYIFNWCWKLDKTPLMSIFLLWSLDVITEFKISNCKNINKITRFWKLHTQEILNFRHTDANWTLSYIYVFNVKDWTFSVHGLVIDYIIYEVLLLQNVK